MLSYFGVSIVPSSHLFPKQMMSHAPRAWWSETKSYARILRASSAPFGRGSKNQKFSFLNFEFSAGGVGGADKKWKGNFWFCFAVSVSEKNNHIITFLFALFSTLTATKAFPYPRLVVTLNSMASTEGGGNSKNMDCARHKQICMCLPRPPSARTNPRRF